MKKVMIGILILIPVIILLLVAAVANIVKGAAHIAVESVSIEYVDETSAKDGRLTYVLSDIIGKPTDIIYSEHNSQNGKIKVHVTPESATDKTITWQIQGSPNCLDAEYKAAYDYFLQNPDTTPVKPAAMLIDGNGAQVETNTTGIFEVNAFCSFTLKAMAENESAIVEVYIAGYDVKTITLADLSQNNGSMTVGQKTRLGANYTPVDSIIENTVWHSSDESVAVVDKNGVVTAVGVGEAKITLSASVYSDSGKTVDSAPFTVNVSEGISSKYGSSMTTHFTTLTLEDAGLTGRTINGYTNCTVAGNQITLNGSAAAVISTDRGDFTINRCSADAIAIKNAGAFSSAYGFVLEVSSLKLCLEAEFLSVQNDGEMNEVAWQSSNESVATVSATGEVLAKSDGTVTITATRNGQSASVQLNVRNKLASMKLLTSDDYYNVGIARETVFASEKYIDASVDNRKEANSVLIRVLGEPQDATAQELADFYGAFVFEVDEADRAYADFDGAVANELVFKPALEGKGKYTVNVKVSAKYPRYESIGLSETVHINVVYGVEASDETELDRATEDQKEYATKEGNVITSQNFYGKDIQVSSQTRYAISVVSDMTPTYDRYSLINIYGDLYGNNKKIVYNGHDGKSLLNVTWSDVTVSNVLLRVNDLGDDAVITDGDDTKDFNGTIVTVENQGDNMKRRLTNIRLEYSTLENAQKGILCVNCDMTVDGCIIRNIRETAMWVPTRIRMNEDLYYPTYSNVVLNNLIMSNMVGTGGSFSYERFSVDKDDNLLFAETFEENEEYLYENFINKGCNSSLRQTGFVDMYNWMPTSNASLVNIDGNDTLNTILRQASGPIIGLSSIFAPLRYHYKNEDWVHLGFMFAGVCTNDGTLTYKEKNYLDYSFEDTRFTYCDLHDINPNEFAGTMYEDIAKTVKELSVKFVGYKNTCSIIPSTSTPYGNPTRYVARLHGEL